MNRAVPRMHLNHRGHEPVPTPSVGEDGSRERVSSDSPKDTRGPEHTFFSHKNRRVPQRGNSH